MRQLTIGLALVAAVTVAAQTAVAYPTRCCSYDGTCSLGVGGSCPNDPCDPGDVCDGVSPPIGCGQLSQLCRVQSTGECVIAKVSCMAAIGCRHDPTCLPPIAPAIEAEIEVTWCEAAPVEVEEAPCEE